MRTLDWKESIILGGPKPRKSIHKMKGYREINLRDGKRYTNECASPENRSNDSENSEESDAESEKTQRKKVQYIPEAQYIPHSFNIPKNVTHQSESFNKHSNETHQSVSFNKHSNETYQFPVKLLFGFIISLIGIILFTIVSKGELPLPPLGVPREDTRHEKALKNNIKNIRKEFPSQVGEVWPTFTAGIRKIQEEPTKPSVFLLLHESEEQTPACLAWKIGKIALNFLNATVQKPLILDGTDIEHDESLLEDYGKLIDDNRHKVEKSHIMIVHNLHKVPAVVAQSFHSFCDTVTPLVDKAVYFFTMKAPGANYASDSPTKLAERELKRLWSNDLDIDILMPLITRITDITMVVKPERDISSSCQR